MSWFSLFNKRCDRPQRVRRVRRLRVELLSPRQLCAADFQNAFNAFDVDDDGLVSPLDALLIQLQLNIDGVRPLAGPRTVQHPFVDVSGDNLVSPLDAILVINQLNTVGTEQVPLVASLSNDSDPNGNGVVLRSRIAIEGQATPEANLKLSLGEEVVLLTTADRSGKFGFTIDVPRGTSQVRLAATDSQHRGGILERSIVYGDVSLDWNATMLTLIRDWTTLSNDPYPNRIVTSQPPMVARNLAMVHAAMYDAVNAIEQTHQPYYFDLEAPTGASPEVAAAAAAHRVAYNLYKDADERALLDASLAEALASVPDGVGETLGIELGRQVGDAILAWRSTDGSATRVTYTPGSEPGDWNRTFPDYYPPLLPQWPLVTPFAMTSGNQFRAVPPPALNSAEYAAAVNEVLLLGGVNSSARTAEQTEIAIFWADGGGSSTPAGHWNQIAADVAIMQERTLAENSRMFAMLNIAMADAGIACWDSKYAFNLWRPIDAIREAAVDGNAGTAANGDWQPLIRTPPFPTYTSGHSTFSGAAASVLNALLGNNVSFASQTDGQTGFTQRPLASERIVTRSFTSFEEAAKEASRSRIYGGIHFEFDSVAGLAIGHSIGELVVDKYLRPLE